MPPGVASRDAQPLPKRSVGQGIFRLLAGPGYGEDNLSVIVHCERCETRFELDDSRLGGSGLRVRCSHCKHAFWLEAPGASRDDVLEHAVREALEPGPPVVEDLLANAAAPGSELGSDEDWEFAEPSGACEDPGEIGSAADAESFQETAEVEADGEAPTLEPLGQGESLSPPDAGSDVPAASTVSRQEPASDLAVDEIDGALAGLSAWEPEAEDSRQPAVAAQEPEPAPVAHRTPPVVEHHEVPERSPQLNRFGTLSGWLAVLFLFTVGLHAGVVVESRPRVVPLRVAEMGGYRLSEVDTRWVDNLHIGPLLVVSGRVLRVESSGAAPLALTLLDAQGVALEGRAIPLGPALPGEVLRLASPQEIRAQQYALGLERPDLRPGEWRRFDAVFEAVPSVASQLRVERLLDSAHALGGG